MPGSNSVFACLLFQVIAVNKQFPGPIMNVTTNYNVVVNVLNSLDEPLLITWSALSLSHLCGGLLRPCAYVPHFHFID